MAPSVEIIKAKPEHAVKLALSLRASDELHLMDAGFKSAFQAVTDSMARSDVSFSCLFNGNVAFMAGFGLGSAITGNIVPWMISGELVYRYPISYGRACKALVAYAKNHWTHISATMEPWTVKDVRWAEFLGFDVDIHSDRKSTIAMRGDS